MNTTREVFFEIQKKMDTIAFIQTEQWFETYPQNMKSNALFFTDSETEPQICCFAFVTRKRFIGKKLIVEGLSYRKEVTQKLICSFFKEMRKLDFDMITVSDIEVYNAEFEVGIRRAGFVRPLGLSLCPMSMIVDLTVEPSYHRNWRRNVKKSRECGNVFEFVEDPVKADADDFANLFLDLKSRKGLSFTLDTNEILTLLKGKYKLFFIRNKEEKRIAGRIEFENGSLIYDTYAANSNEAIKSGAAYHIQESIFDFYREKGAMKFDYGRIPPSDGPMDDIYVAKSYSGGYPVAYNGQWIFCKSLLMNYIYSFLIHYIHKSILY